LIGRRVFLPTTKAKQSEKEKHDNRDFHFCSKLEFVFPRSVFYTKDSPVR
jgi:hypothetical protein